MTAETRDSIPWKDESIEQGEYVRLNPEGTRGFGYSQKRSWDKQRDYVDEVLRFFVKIHPYSVFSLTAMKAVNRRYANGERTEFIQVNSRGLSTASGSSHEVIVTATYGRDGVKSNKAVIMSSMHFGVDGELQHEYLPMTENLPPVIDTQATSQALYDQAHEDNFQTPQLIPPSTP